METLSIGSSRRSWSLSCCCLAMKLLEEFYQRNSLSMETLEEIEGLSPEGYAELYGLLRVAPPSEGPAQRCQHILYQLEFVFDENHNLLVEDEHCRALTCEGQLDQAERRACWCPV